MFETDVLAALRASNLQIQEPKLSKKELAAAGKTVALRERQALFGQKVQPIGKWSASWDEFYASLERLGYDSLQSYFASDHWSGIDRSYRNSLLLQKCMVCGDPKFQLYHQQFNRLGHEEIGDLLPLCSNHYQKLYAYLAEHGWGIQSSQRVLSLCTRDDGNYLLFNQRMVPYRKHRLAYRLDQFGLKMDYRPYQIGNKGAKSRSKKTLIIKTKTGSPVGQCTFWVSKGMIQLGHNKRSIDFDYFVNKLPKYVQVLKKLRAKRLSELGASNADA